MQFKVLYMKNKQDYFEEISEIRSLMERSSKFTSVSGLSGILAGIYALVGAFLLHTIVGFRPYGILESEADLSGNEWGFFFIGAGVLILAVGTAVYLSYRKARILREPMWTATTRNMLFNMALPLLAGGVIVIVFFSYGLVGLLLPVTLIFYGLALYSAGNFTYPEIRILGIIVTVIGLLAFCLIEYSVLLWAAGFGLMHIVYGTLIFLRHEK